MTASPSNLSAAFPRYRTPRGAAAVLDEPAPRLALPAAPESPVAVVDDPFWPPGSSDDAPPPGSRRPPLLVLIAAALVAIILGYIVVSLVREPSGRGGGRAASAPPGEQHPLMPPFVPAPSAAAPGQEPGSAIPAGPPGLVDPGASVPVPPVAPPVAPPAPPVAPPPPAPPPQPALAARYVTLENEGPILLPGYRGRVVIENRSRSRTSGWRVEIVLPPTQRIHRLAGARAEQRGSVVTFTPVSRTRRIAPGSAVVFAFDVITARNNRPTRCTINDNPCD